MLVPLLPPPAQVPSEGLLPPRAPRGVADGGEGADAPIPPRVPEEEGQGAVAAHGVAGDGDAAGVELGVVQGQQGRELLGDVRLHVVVCAPGVAGGVEVEARRAAKVPVGVLARVVRPARGRVGVEDGEAEAGGVGVEEALLRAVVGGAGQAREEDEQRGGGRGGRAAGDEEVQVHGGFGRGRVVRELVDCAAEGGDG